MVSTVLSALEYAVKAGPDGHRRVKCQHKAKKPNVYNVHIKYTSSTAQGGGGSFKNRRRIGEIDCCE